jgi:phosphotransferase system enzyme I (PtsI)
MKKGIIQFKGIPASPGKFYGRVVKIISSSYLILETHISEKKVELEVGKFYLAIKKTKKELESIIQKNSSDIQTELKDILISQTVMLDDPLLLQSVEKRIRENLENSPYALFHAIENISKEFEEIENEYFRERAEDIRDIGKRIENNLIGKKSDYHILSDINEPVLIVATELTPSQILHMDKKNVKGIATEKGGRTGHMAILAKYFEIPAVVGLGPVTDEIKDGENVFLDGDSGLLIKNPNPELIRAYVPYCKLEDKEYYTTSSITTTLDGERIYIKTNLESDLDSHNVLKVGSDGVGLYRTEILLMEEGRSPSEEEQFYNYKKIAISLENKQFVIRTFDVGADKMDSGDKEANPFLGNRGIRYCLRKKDWFKKQLRAILRASAYGNIWMMLPMITQMSEIIETKNLISECKNELTARGIKFKVPKLGIMVETPACAWNLEQFATMCDFFSVGTNDLLQYFVAVDRNNTTISYLYNPYNFAFLRTLEHIINVSKNSHIPLSICGELASDLNFTILLIGLGFRDLSVSLPFVRKVRKIIQGIDIPQTKKLTKQVMKFAKEERFVEVESFLFNQHMQ